MGLYSTFQTSQELEKRGVRFIITNTRITAKRAGASNKGYLAALADYQAKNRRKAELGAIDTEEGMRSLVGIYADHVIVDWETNLNDAAGFDENSRPIEPQWERGIENPAGGPLLPVTRENIVNTLLLLPDLFVWLKESCESIQNFRAQKASEIAGK